MRKGVAQHSYACVSADYRLAPQVPISAILEDVRDVIVFVRSRLASHAPADTLDTSRLAVSGSSAGGYLALLAGLYIEPKPQVILPIYPITDPLGWFFTNSQPPPMGRELVSKEHLAEFLDRKAVAVANCMPNAKEDARMHMYVRMLADANLAELWAVPKDAGEETEKWRLSHRIRDWRTPPTYVLHGDSDTCVGVEQADEVVGAMVGCGIEVVYERPRGKDHFLDIGQDYENDAFFKFMFKHL